MKYQWLSLVFVLVGCQDAHVRLNQQDSDVGDAMIDLVDRADSDTNMSDAGTGNAGDADVLAKDVIRTVADVSFLGDTPADNWVFDPTFGEITYMVTQNSYPMRHVEANTPSGIPASLEIKTGEAASIMFIAGEQALSASVWVSSIHNVRVSLVGLNVLGQSISVDLIASEERELGGKRWVQYAAGSDEKMIGIGALHVAVDGVSGIAHVNAPVVKATALAPAALRWLRPAKLANSSEAASLSDLLNRTREDQIRSEMKELLPKLNFR